MPGIAVSARWKLTKEEVQKKLAAHKDELKKMHVARLSLFGSVLHGTAGGESDVDLIVDFTEPVGLFNLFELQHRLEEILGVSKVDLVQRGALHPLIRDQVLMEARIVA
jgi:predicted nucleotidyltransferase